MHNLDCANKDELFLKKFKNLAYFGLCLNSNFNFVFILYKNLEICCFRVISMAQDMDHIDTSYSLYKK